MVSPKKIFFRKSSFHKHVLSIHYVSNKIVETRDENENIKRPLCHTHKKYANYSLYYFLFLGTQEDNISQTSTHNWVLSTWLNFGQYNVGRGDINSFQSWPLKTSLVIFQLSLIPWGLPISESRATRWRRFNSLSLPSDFSEKKFLFHWDTEIWRFICHHWIVFVILYSGE